MSATVLFNLVCAKCCGAQSMAAAQAGEILAAHANA